MCILLEQKDKSQQCDVIVGNNRSIGTDSLSYLCTFVSFERRH